MVTAAAEESAPRTTLETASAYVAAGLSVVPILPDGTKRPALRWAEFEQRPATEGELRLWFRAGKNGVGIVCGLVSGGLEVIDFDRDRFADWRQLVKAEASGLTDRLPLVATPSGGVHIYFRCPVVAGNQKLAVAADKAVIVETRGEGGFVVAPGSPRGCHPSGRSYRLLQGDLLAIPEITPAERGFLLDAARSFNEYVAPQLSVRAPAPKRAATEGQRSGDAYNAQTTWHDVLEPAGWRLVGRRGDVDHWRRPGKDTIGWSATTNHAGSDLLYVFSSNAVPFEPERSYDRFAAYTLLKHGGDFSAAAQALAAEGYGDRPLEVDATKPSTNGLFASQYENNESNEINGWPAPPDAAAFYGLAGDVVATCDRHTEADRTGILVQFLAAFANAVGPGPHVVVGATRHRTILNVAIVGRSSRSRKGDSWQYVASLLSDADKDWAVQCVTTGLSTGEGLIHAVRDPSEDGNDGVRDRRALVVETEFGRTLRVMARDGNTLSAVLRDAWDGRDLRVMTRGMPLRASGAHVGIIGHITLAELRRELSSTDASNGFANRFDWVCVQRSKALANPPPLPAAEVVRLVDRIRGTLEVSRGYGSLGRDDACLAAWEALYPALTEDLDGIAGEVLARSEAQVLRLSIIYALLDASPIIRVPHLAAALALWDYCVASVQYVFGSASNDAVAEEILRHLKTAGELTRTEISGRLGRNVRGDRISLALETLEQSGRAARRIVATEKRPAEVWRATGKPAKAATPLLDRLSSLISSISYSDAKTRERENEHAMDRPYPTRSAPEWPTG